MKRIKKIINNIKNRLFPEYELSDREKKLFSIVCNAVDNVNSLIYNNFNSCYIINRNDKFYIRLNINKISIIKNNSLYVFNITIEFFDYIKSYINDHIISEISNINVNEFDKIEDNSIDKLM